MTGSRSESRSRESRYGQSQGADFGLWTSGMNIGRFKVQMYYATDRNKPVQLSNLLRYPSVYDDLPRARGRLRLVGLFSLFVFSSLRCLLLSLRT